MERQPANALDERISRMAEALRGEEMPLAPARLLTGGVIRHRSTRGRTLIAAGSGIAAIAIVTALMLPRESAAAELYRIVQTGDGVLRHQLGYDRQPDGTWMVTSDIYVDGSHFHSIPHDGVAENFIGDGRTINYFRKEGYAIIEPYRPRGEGVFYHSSMKRQLGFDHVKSVTRAGSVDWKGMRLQRFNVHSEFMDALNQLLSSDGYLLADPATDRPYYEEFTITGDHKGQFIGGRTGAMEWQYPEGEEAKLALNLPQGTRVYDVEKLREQVKEQVTGSLGTDTVAGIQVTLRGVYLSEYGVLSVFTTGGAGRIEDYNAGLRVDGRETHNFGGQPGAIGESQNHVRRIADREVCDPLVYRGVKLVFQEGVLEKGFSIADTFDLQVPVFAPDHSALGRHFAGYAKFGSVTPTRIAGQVLTYLNRSILWTAQDNAIEDARQRAEYGSPTRAVR